MEAWHREKVFHRKCTIARFLTNSRPRKKNLKKINHGHRIIVEPYPLSVDFFNSLGHNYGSCGLERNNILWK